MRKMMMIFSSMLIAGAFALQATAASITWDPAFDVTGPNDIDTSGVHFDAASPGGNALNTVTANGEDIDFIALGINPLGRQAATMLISNGDGSPFQNVLNTVSYGCASCNTHQEFDLAGLTSGQDYQLQVFYVDSRATSTTREMVFSSAGGNNVSVTATGAGLGQTAIGTFTADDVSQTIVIDSVNAGRTHINAYVVRAVPEPSSIILLLMGVFGAAIFRKKYHK